MSAMDQAMSWTKNMLGLPLTDSEMKTIPYPGTELGVHITTKTVQAGSFLGGFVIGPIYGFLRKRASAMRFGARGAAIGLVLGPIMTWGHENKLKYGHDGWFDRSYRLRHNAGQVNVDRCSYVAALIGLAGGGLAGSALGIRLAVVGAGAYNNFLKPKPETSAESEAKKANK